MKLHKELCPELPLQLPPDSVEHRFIVVVKHFVQADYTITTGLARVLQVIFLSDRGEGI